MTRSTNDDPSLSAWLREEFRPREPAGLLERVVAVTADRQPRPAWAGRLLGHHLRSRVRPGLPGRREEAPMNRSVPLLVGLAAVALAVIVGANVLGSVPGPAAAGPSAVASPSPV